VLDQYCSDVPISHSEDEGAPLGEGLDMLETYTRTITTMSEALETERDQPDPDGAEGAPETRGTTSSRSRCSAPSWSSTVTRTTTACITSSPWVDAGASLNERTRPELPAGIRSRRTGDFPATVSGGGGGHTGIGQARGRID
jgi:hypothetical protein